MKKLLILSFFILFLFLTSYTPVSASHSWGNYHWGRTANPLNLKLGDNLSSSWDPYLVTSSSDWSTSSVLDTTIVAGLTTGRRCRATNGRVEACNYRYGNNGWLGLAQIWVNGSNHITQGIIKVNDTYFNTSTYNTLAWRNMVMCQEIAHTFGLDHQDEDFYNNPLGTCMDYSADPTPNQHPNAHDYEQLELIYAHLDSVNTSFISASSARFQDEAFDIPQNWGRVVRASKASSIFEKDLGNKNKVFTFVTWAQ